MRRSRAATMVPTSQNGMQPEYVKRGGYLTASCAKTRPMGLRGRAVVELEHAAEALRAISTDILEFRGRVLVIRAARAEGRLRAGAEPIGRPRDPLSRAVASRRTGPRNSDGRLR